MSNIVECNEQTLISYFKDIDNIELLSQEEELVLAKRIKLGDISAVKELVSRNLKFVVSIAKEYKATGVHMIDLIADGNEGLLKAAYKFDHTKGFRFISYAVWWIRQSILYGLSTNSRLVRLPINVINNLNDIKKQISKFKDDNNRLPNNEEIVGVDMYKMLTNNESVSLGSCETLEVCDDIIDEDSDRLIKMELNNILSKLTNRELDIIKLYFGFSDEFGSMTLESIGEKYNLTKERIRQIKERAIRKLRHNMGDLHNLVNHNG